jgi:hypothetical protein
MKLKKESRTTFTLLLIVSVFALMTQPGCLSLFRSREVPIQITTDPPNATASYGACTVLTPSNMTVPRTASGGIIISKDGYKTETHPITSYVNGWAVVGSVLLNATHGIFTLGISAVIGIGFDASQGVLCDVRENSVSVTLSPDQEIVALKGKSSFEKTMIGLVKELNPIEPPGPIAIGVITKENTSEPSALTPFIVPELEAKLVQSGMNIVSYKQLNEILVMQKISTSELFDQQEIPRIGKLIPAKAIVLGRLYHEGYQCRVSMQVIDLESGIVKKSSTKVIRYEDIPPVAYLRIQEQYSQESLK